MYLYICDRYARAYSCTVGQYYLWSEGVCNYFGQYPGVIECVGKVCNVSQVRYSIYGYCLSCSCGSVCTADVRRVCDVYLVSPLCIGCYQ